MTSFFDLKKTENNIKEIKKIKAGTYVNICNEFNPLKISITLNKQSSLKLLIKEKIKNTIKLDDKHIKRDAIYLIQRSLIIFIKF